MPHEILSQYDIYFWNGSHFTKILNVALLSVRLNLEALYLAQLCIHTGATYRTNIMHLQIIFLKLWIFKKFTFCTFWLTYMPKILTPPSFVIVYMMTYCRCLWCLLILYLVANCQMSSGPHGPILLVNTRCLYFMKGFGVSLESRDTLNMYLINFHNRTRMAQCSFITSIVSSLSLKVPKAFRDII